MKAIRILVITMLFIVMLQTVNATDIDMNTIIDGDDFGQVDIDMKDTYLINDTRQLNTMIKINTNIDKKQYVHSFIDGRNIESEAKSGGYIEDTNEYVLPHDLGLGFHTLQFLIEENGEYIGKATYNFAIAKSNDDNLEKYKGFTPYYYEDGFDVDEDLLEEDYKEFMELYSMIDSTPEITNMGNMIASEPMKVNVNLGIIGDIDDSLTSKEINNILC